MNKEHPLFEQSIEFLKNSGDVPVPTNVNERFETTAVILKEIYLKTCDASEGTIIAKQNRLWLKIISGSSGFGFLLILLKLLDLF